LKWTISRRRPVTATVLLIEYKARNIDRLTLGVFELNTSRSILPLIAGWLCLVFAVVLLAFSALMLFLQTPPLTCIVIGSTSLFPAMMAVACLLPSKRTIALRLIGAVVCFACVGTLIMSFVTPPGNGQGRPRREILVVIAIAGGAMAIKGKWPGSENMDETAREHK
jgi:hypothetical protein